VDTIPLDPLPLDIEWQFRKVRPSVQKTPNSWLSTLFRISIPKSRHLSRQNLNLPSKIYISSRPLAWCHPPGNSFQMGISLRASPLRAWGLYRFYLSITLWIFLSVGQLSFCEIVGTSGFINYCKHFRDRAWEQPCPLWFITASQNLWMSMSLDICTMTNCIPFLSLHYVSFEQLSLLLLELSAQLEYAWNTTRRWLAWALWNGLFTATPQ